MKRATAITHLVEMADLASELHLRAGRVGGSLEELWVTGELLGLADTIQTGWVVLVLDLPPDELPWLAANPTAEAVAHLLGLGKRPVNWWYRPLGWPVWNPEHRRLVRFWTASTGTDAGVIEALRSRRLDLLDVVEPTFPELVEQLRVEPSVSRQHLRTTLDRYWERDWRREHKGFDQSPEDHLWRAAAAVEQLRQALESPAP